MVVDDSHFVGRGWEDWGDYMIRLVEYDPPTPEDINCPAYGPGIALEVWANISDCGDIGDYYRGPLEGDEYQKVLDMWCDRNLTSRGTLKEME